MKNRQVSMYGVIMSAAVFFVLVLFSSGHAAEPAPIELKFNYMYNTIALPGRACEYWANLINTRSKGRVKITTYAAGTLLPPDRLYEGVVTGIVDIGQVSPSYVATRFPANDATLLPYRMQSGWVYTQASNDWVKKFKPKEYDDVHMFNQVSPGPYVIGMRNKPVAKPEDLKGMKLRASGTQAAAFIKALGATPVNMPMAEAFESLQRGVIDGTLAPVEPLKAWKHAEVIKYETKLPLSCVSGNNLFMNLQKWNSLPPDIKKIFDDADAETVEVFAKAWWYGDIAAEDYFLSLGGGRQFVEIAPADLPLWEKLVDPLRSEYIATHKNLPAAEYIKYLDERVEYWNGRQPDKKSVVDWVEKELLKGAK
jgi:TRAP-type C4-dicarboxylate transport system substrate-binding protein